MSSATVTLEIFLGGQCIATHRMARELVKIGRLPTSHVRLEDDAIARMHAVLERSGDELRVVDLGSTTGTMVNGVPVDRSSVVRPGDRIEIGPYSMRVDLESLPTTALPEPTVTRATRPASIAVDAASVEQIDAPAVAQVIARWNQSVLDVQHVGHAKRHKVDASAWMALGALLSLGGAALFAGEVAQDWSAYQGEARAAADAGRSLPPTPGHGVGGLGIVLALAGLVPLGIGVVRRNERPRSSYVIGERPDASFTVSGEGIGDGFELVERNDRGVTLRLLPSMHGRLENDGVVHRIDTVPPTSPARVLALPTGSKAQVHFGALVFDVAAVPPGRVAAGRSETDKPYWMYNAASFFIIAGMLGLGQLIPQGELGMNSDENLADSRYVGYLHQPEERDETPPDEVEADSPDAKSVAGLAGQRHVGNEGQAGNPSAKAVNKMYARRGPKDALPMLARSFDPDRDARNAGILGTAQLEQGGFLASPYASAFQVGNDEEDLWGNISGDQLGEASGFGGLGLVGTGRLGGGTGEGTIGLTGIGLIGQRGANGDRLGYGNRNGEGKTDAFGGRKQRVPIARIARGERVNGIDKEIIRRVVRAHINEVRGCYSEGLGRSPNLNGRVAISFTIGPAGNVSASAVAESSLGDPRVESCIAKAVRRWKFSTGSTGGSAMVTYPFVLSPG
ncbi:MAG: TonB family protein [Deltaproteobacteria bacterium]|nr:TonB family protein [Nannocystaceae bacterium]